MSKDRSLNTRTVSISIYRRHAPLVWKASEQEVAIRWNQTGRWWSCVLSSRYFQWARGIGSEIQIQTRTSAVLSGMGLKCEISASNIDLWFFSISIISNDLWCSTTINMLSNAMYFDDVWKEALNYPLRGSLRLASNGFIPNCSVYALLSTSFVLGVC